MVCVPKNPAMARGDLIPLTDMSGWVTTGNANLIGNNAASVIFKATTAPITNVYAA